MGLVGSIWNWSVDFVNKAIMDLTMQWMLGETPWQEITTIAHWGHVRQCINEWSQRKGQQSSELFLSFSWNTHMHAYKHTRRTHTQQRMPKDVENFLLLWLCSDWYMYNMTFLFAGNSDSNCHSLLWKMLYIPFFCFANMRILVWSMLWPKVSCCRQFWLQHMLKR